MKALARPSIPITSHQNAVLKSFRRAARDAGEFCVAEGPRLLAEAIQARVAIRAVLLAEDSAPERLAALPADVRVYRISRHLFDSVATTESPQGVAALIRRPSWPERELFTSESPLLLLLDGIQHPGNVGTILRSAAALGASGAMLLRGTADPFNPKALRASAGAAFRLPTLTALTPAAAIALLRAHRVRILACVVRAGKLLAEVNCQPAVAIAIGSEGAGLGKDILAAADERVSLPMRADVESLNAAMAASMALYEAARQRAFRF